MSLGVPGLALVTGWVSADEERALIDAIDAGEWSTELSRRVQHHGFRYDYRGRDVDPLGPLPAWADALARRLSAEGRFLRAPDQVIVNEYQPGQGIAPHVDRDLFGSTVASLTLAAPTTMDLRDGDDTVEVRLDRRSLLVLARAARRRWTHAIAPRRSDVVAGVRTPRERRLSITFRTVGDTPLPAPSIDDHAALLRARLAQLDAPLRAGLAKLRATSLAPDIDLLQLELFEDIAAEAFPIIGLGKRRRDGVDRYTHGQSIDPRRFAAATIELVTEPLVHAALARYHDNEALPDDVLDACDLHRYEAVSAWFIARWDEVIGDAVAAYFIRLGDDAADRAWDLRARRVVRWDDMY